MADAMTDALHCAEAFLRPAHVSAVESLGLNDRSAGLDLGCGVGSIWPVVSSLVGAETKLTAIDKSENCVAEARKRVAASGFREPVDLRHTSVESFFDTNVELYDWIWTADVLSPRLFEDIPAIVRRCADLIRPGPLPASRPTTIDLCFCRAVRASNP